MNTRFCPETHAWITGLEDAAAPPAPPPDRARHVAGCPRCRGALLLLVTELLQAPLDVEQTTCDQCQDDLAAYVELERAEGLREALTAHPHVWWHLWTCVDCAESYRLVLALQEAEAANELPPAPLSSLVSPPRSQQPGPLVRRFTLLRSALIVALVPQFGTSLGGLDEDAVIHEDADEGYELRTSVRRLHGQWMITVTIEPPIVGAVVVKLGAAMLRAEFDPLGRATLGPLPVNLLASPAGPDMEVRIEPAD